MGELLRKSDHVDIMMLAEGTYPFVRGGVSSWIHQIITEMPEFSFGICFIGSREADYEGGIRYELPDNLTHLEVHYMFTSEEASGFKVKESNRAIKNVKALHRWFETQEHSLPPALKSIDFYTKEVTKEFFMHSKGAWHYLTERYFENASDVPFIEYFWALRNMHSPIWLLADIVKALPECGVFHSPSTGYAGFMGALAANHTGKPFLLTEHGIYTRERKIDLLNADWITYNKSRLLKHPEEFNYIKQMWINFFTKIGEFAYHHAQKVFSLFPGAMEIQKQLGAEPEKLEVIPNGVNVDRLAATIPLREPIPPHVITLIGRVVSIKDIKTFIRAMRIVINELPDAQGWIVGPTEEDPEYFDECVNMVESLELNDHVLFLGFQNIVDILPKTGIQTLTSISEGMPLVILEGFAAGVPCIATDVGSCRNLIEGALDEEDIAIGHAGAVTNIANPTELAQAYIAYLTDHTLWEAASQAAIERVNRYYRQEMFLQRYRDYYHKALEHGRHRV